MGPYDDDDLTVNVSSRKPRHAARMPDDVAEDIRNRLAATTVRRMCNQHQCTATATTPCAHPNHRRDADLLLSTDAAFPGMLDMLGLDAAWNAVNAAEQRAWLRWIRQSGPADDIAA